MRGVIRTIVLSTRVPAPTLQVLKFLPMEKAKDARNFVQALQYWLGGNRENLENLLLSTAQVPVVACPCPAGPAALAVPCLPAQAPVTVFPTHQNEGH